MPLSNVGGNLFWLGHGRVVAVRPPVERGDYSLKVSRVVSPTDAKGKVVWLFVLPCLYTSYRV